MPQQTLLFLSTVAGGAVIGLIYDFFRIFRKTTPHKGIFIQLEDMLFWLTATGLFFYFMLNENYGEIRFFSILGIALGMVLYFATVSVLIVRLSVILINFMKRVVSAAIKIVLLPVKLLITLFMPPLKKLAQFVHKRLHALRFYGKMKLKKTFRDLRIIRKKV
jgi:spore cortex biosynthesis protein YabQ